MPSPMTAPRKRRLTAKQKRMEAAVTFLHGYMASYSQQLHFRDYSDETLINDVLYGLGCALNDQEYRCAAGFDRWKAKLREHLEAAP